MGTSYPKHDYDRLRREYIAGGISIRQLCIKHGIKSYSAVAQYAREHGWYQDKADVEERAKERTIEKVSERISDEDADIITQFREESLTVVRAALYKFAEDLKDPEFRVRADDLVKMIQLGLLITGQPTSRVEERRLDVHATFDNIPDDVLRRLVDATRSRPALSGPIGADSRPSAQDPRQN